MFADPKLNVAKLNLKDGMRVADFGAGNGAYEKPLSEKVGPTGKVYAIEVQKNMVKLLEADLKSAGISNVDCIWGDIERLGGTKIADGTMDAVIISNVLSQSSDRLGLIDEARRILKKGGKALLVDWRESLGTVRAAANQIVKEDTAIELFTRRGFKQLETISDSEHHYGIIFIHE
jgi:ubiquinone/menaquinone biosynthesis C-methylase UbiE